MKTAFRRFVSSAAVVLGFLAWMGFGPSAVADVATYKYGANDPFTAVTYTNTEDVWIYANNNLGGGAGQEDNKGNDTRFVVGGATDALGPGTFRHELVRFNVNSLSGRFLSISSVTLRLYWTGGAGGPGTVQMFPFASANAAWTEGPGGAYVPGAACWAALAYGVTSWAGSAGASTPGVDYVNTMLASAAYTGSESGSSSFDLTWNDTSLINTWLTGSNPGLYLRTVTQNNQAIFNSSESTAAYTPELIISYAAIPEPSLLSLVALGGLLFLRRKP